MTNQDKVTPKTMSSLSHPLVSIITPCYNGAHCVHRLFDSIIAQTYRPIEFILINDGSTDETLQVVDEYRPKFQTAGIEFHCHTQENRGLSGAINAGLRLFKGEYLCWPDADDYLEPSSVEDRVQVLQQHPCAAVVTSDAYMRKSENLDKVVKYAASRYPHSSELRQFEYLLNGDSLFCPGCHLVRTSCFLEVNPDRQIYDCRRGQNWQMLLPLYFKYDRVFLNKPLYNYVVYPHSMSHGDDKKLENYIRRYTEHKDILLATLQKIQEVQHVDMHKYFSFVEDKYGKLFMETAIRFRNRPLFLDVYAKKQRMVGLDCYDYIANLRSKCYLLNGVLSLFCKRIRKGGYSKLQIRLRTPESVLDVAKAPIVSIITPCYNGEHFLQAYFRSLKEQSYKRLEIIFVNDGSTDNTAEIAKKNGADLKKYGIQFIYLEQSNQGAAAAVNNALKYVTGQYLMLYDVDDVLYRDAVYRKVIYLLTNPACSMVRNNGYYVKAPYQIGKKYFEYGDKFSGKNECYKGLVNATCTNWTGTYLINFERFKKTNGGLDIYISQFGQNLQMMLPVAYENTVGYIRTPLMNYYVRSDSHSHYVAPGRKEEKIHGYAMNRLEILRQMKNLGCEVDEDIKTCLKNENKSIALCRKSRFFRIPSFFKHLLNSCLRLKENLYNVTNFSRY